MLRVISTAKNIPMIINAKTNMLASKFFPDFENSISFTFKTCKTIYFLLMDDVLQGGLLLDENEGRIKVTMILNQSPMVVVPDDRTSAPNVKKKAGDFPPPK